MPAAKNSRRSPTKTSGFGVSRRESHDSSGFYGRRLYGGNNNSDNDNDDDGNNNNNNSSNGDAAGHYPENRLPEGCANRIFCKSSERMDELPDSCVHLLVTSPPYNVGKEYDSDLTLGEYRQLLQSVFAEAYRVLVHGGRACINIANVGRKPYIPLHSHVIADMLAAGFLMRGEVIWNKGPSAGASTAWGSWQSAANPTLRDTHEYILVFSKGTFSRKAAEGKKSTISKEQFLEYTRSVWEFPAESARRVGHPAPFPVELPHRCIQLYTFEGDVVLDPFCGVGATCVAAAASGRLFVGYETRAEYTEKANERLAALPRPSTTTAADTMQKRNMQRLR
ncbi:site-specific DNA-methyltransferase [Nitrososphaera sp.]|uniref:DNA-methyltransferase n=1 Tax=Nitrososphaera sp. TaxID=1971748 RepID=UPI00307F2127